jgi:hypothetical protein
LNGFADIQPEHFAIVRTRKTLVEPSAQVDRRPHARHAFAVDGREDRATNQDFATGITFAFSVAGAREQAPASGA